MTSEFIQNIDYAYKEHILSSTRHLLSTNHTEYRSDFTIHIVSLNVWPSDAVSNHTIELAIFLSALGLKVQMYGHGVHERYSNFHLPREDVFRNARTNDVLFYQYSIGDEFLTRLVDLPIRKIAYYHGITPPELIRHLDPEVANACEKGINDLSLLQSFDHIFSNSMFNLREVFEAIGYSIDNSETLQLQVLPPYLTLSKLPSRYDKSPLPIENLAYVGRAYPHKNIEAIIRFFAAYRKKVPNARLKIVGAGHSEPYLKHIKDLSREYFKNNHQNIIRFENAVSDLELDALYKWSGMLLQFSNHEGFGMPLVEAMKTCTVVVTHKKCALPETMHGSGIMVAPGCPEESADQVLKLTNANTSYHALLRSQLDVFGNYYSEQAVQEKYLNRLIPALTNDLK